MMTDTEKLIWASAYALAARASEQRRQTSGRSDDLYSILDSAWYAIDRFRNTKLDDSIRNEDEVTDLYYEMKND